MSRESIRNMSEEQKKEVRESRKSTRRAYLKSMLNYYDIEAEYVRYTHRDEVQYDHVLDTSERIIKGAMNDDVDEFYFVEPYEFLQHEMD